MMFEVINQEGICIMYTNNADSIYPYDLLKQMQSAGYKFRLNGKRAAPETIVKFESISSAASPKSRSHKTKPKSNL